MGESGVFIGIRPEALSVGNLGDTALKLEVAVTSVESLGHEQLVYCQLLQPQIPEVIALEQKLPAFGATPGQLVARLLASPAFQSGSRLDLSVEYGHIHFFDAEGICRGHGTDDHGADLGKRSAVAS